MTTTATKTIITATITARDLDTTYAKVGTIDADIFADGALVGGVSLQLDHTGEYTEAGAPLDGWASEELVAYARTMDDDARKDFLGCAVIAAQVADGRPKPTGETMSTTPETLDEFISRIHLHAGLHPSDIPDGSAEDAQRGQIWARSPLGLLVAVDYVDEDADGYPIYMRVVMIRRDDALPRALPGARGLLLGGRLDPVGPDRRPTTRYPSSVTDREIMAPVRAMALAEEDDDAA